MIDVGKEKTDVAGGVEDLLALVVGEVVHGVCEVAVESEDPGESLQDSADQCEVSKVQRHLRLPRGSLGHFSTLRAHPLSPLRRGV